MPRTPRKQPSLTDFVTSALAPLLQALPPAERQAAEATARNLIGSLPQGRPPNPSELQALLARALPQPSQQQQQQQPQEYQQFQQVHQQQLTQPAKMPKSKSAPAKSSSNSVPAPAPQPRVAAKRKHKVVHVEVTLEDLYKGCVKTCSVGYRGDASKGQRRARAEFSVEIPPGTTVNDTIKLKSSASPQLRDVPFDLHVRTDEVMDPRYDHIDEHLVLVLTLSMADCCAFDICVPHPSGVPLRIAWPRERAPLFGAQRILKVPGKGMPVFGKPGQFGNLYVQIQPTLPDEPVSVSEADLAVLQRLFGSETTSAFASGASSGAPASTMVSVDDSDEDIVAMMCEEDVDEGDDDDNDDECDEPEEDDDYVPDEDSDDDDDDYSDEDDDEDDEEDEDDDEVEEDEAPPPRKRGKSHH